MFSDILNDYRKILEISQANLAKESGISAGVISRYTSGERTPKKNSESVFKLAQAIVNLAEKKGVSGIKKDEVISGLNESCTLGMGDSAISSALDTIIKTYGIKNSALAEAINMDASFLSRVKSGKRMPSDRYAFIRDVCKYVSDLRPEADYEELLGLFEEGTSVPAAAPRASSMAASGVSSDNNSVKKSVESYDVISDIKKGISSFDLEKYYASTHFDRIKVPSLPVIPAPNREFTGEDALKKSWLTFLKYAVSSSDADNIYIYTDSNESNDKEFAKKKMYALFLALKKGIDIHIIHGTDSLEDIQAYFPLYATGKVSGYITSSPSSQFCHTLMAGRSVSLSGFSLKDFESSGCYTISGSTDRALKISAMLAEIITKAKSFT